MDAERLAAGSLLTIPEPHQHVDHSEVPTLVQVAMLLGCALGAHLRSAAMTTDLVDVRGGKRMPTAFFEIASGGHSLLFTGPPGKSSQRETAGLRRSIAG